MKNSELNSARILIVDDQPTNIRQLQILLKRRGFENLRETTDPRETLALCLEYDPDLLLLDLNMPHLDGYQVLEQLKQELPGDAFLPILVLTADATSKAKERALSLGAKDFLAKPLDHVEVLLRIRNLLETRALYLRIQDENQSLGARVDEQTRNLARSEARNRRIVEGNVDGMVVISMQGRPLFVNPAAERLIGQLEKDHNGLFGELVSAKKGSEELEIIRPDQSKVLVEIKTAGIEWDGESAVLASLRDITELKRTQISLTTANEELRNALAELQSAQSHIVAQERLRALGEMASGIAHDFNNALSPILGYSELLLSMPDVLEDVEKTSRFLRTINTAAEDASAIVGRLREFYRARDEHDVRLPVYPNDLVNQAIEMTQPKWKDQAQSAGISIDVNAELANVPCVPANETELREALTNLIFNAVDAMPAGGTLTLSTRPDGEHSVAIEVRDTGTGMTEEVQRRCFDPFFSTKGDRGTGIGLAMVFGIVDRHEGSIEIQTAPGQGTAFIIRLPAFEVHSAGEHETKSVMACRNLRILVVEDEGSIRALLSDYLNEDGHELEFAANGLEGYEKFRTGRFDLVITDRSMPDMNGDQLAIAIKKIAPRKPIIMVTGFGVLMNDDDEKPAGVDLLISKPLKLETLRATIEEAMKQV